MSYVTLSGVELRTMNPLTAVGLRPPPLYQHFQMWIFPANSSARGRISTPLSTATIFGNTIDYKTHCIPARPFDVMPDIIT